MELEEQTVGGSSISRRDSSGKTYRQIGPYYYRKSDIIGRGFSSTVYRATRQDNNTVYAIKAVRLKSLELTRKLLIEGEIAVLKQIHHANILKIFDVYSTANHTYIVTEYCEGGTLEAALQRNELTEWKELFQQIGAASKYLGQNGIIHRDIKPANIFKKGTVWKIGDFGFARVLQTKKALLVERYTIGSPLYMPLQALESNVYSSKTDTFALGVVIYHVMTKQLPWPGGSRNQIIKAYKGSKCNGEHIAHLSYEAKTLLRRMLSLDVVQRPFILDIDFRVLTCTTSLAEVEAAILTLVDLYSEQALLCQFIYYIMMNASLFLDRVNVLFTMVARQLAHLVRLYKWEQKNSFFNLMRQFMLPTEQDPIDRSFYEQIRKTITQHITLLRPCTGRVQQSGMEKLLQYYQILCAICQNNPQKLLLAVRDLQLHKDFSFVIPNQNNIQRILQSTRMYE